MKITSTLTPQPVALPRTQEAEAYTERYGDFVKRALVGWQDFLSFADARSHSRWVFRGLTSTQYSLLPGAGRTPNYSSAFEKRAFQSFKREARLHIELGAAMSDWDWLAIGQHHGLPTRLMDWTSNPLVACYFAVTCSRHDEEQDAIVFAHSVSSQEIVDPDIWPRPFEITQVGFLIPNVFAQRMATQRGLFSAHPQPNNPWSHPELNRNSFVIRRELKPMFRKKLFQLGFDAFHIRPGLDGLCEALKWRYENQIGIGTIR